MVLVMKKNEKNIKWSSGEIIYKIDTEPNGMFIIMSGTVEIFSRDGFLLNKLGEKEILGETSTILNLKRSVTAKAGPSGASAIYIKTNKLQKMIRQDKALGAVIKKTQIRLMDSNNQSEELYNILDEIISNTNLNDKKMDEVKKLINKAKTKVSKIRFSNID